MFGVTCSPFLLNATLDHHFERYRHSHPDLVDQLKRSVYVDNVFLGADTEELALQHCQEAKSILKKRAQPPEVSYQQTDPATETGRFGGGCRGQYESNHLHTVSFGMVTKGMS